MSDEDHCTCNFGSMSSQCKFVSVNKKKLICFPLYYKGQLNKCYSYAKFRSVSKAPDSHE